MQVLEMISMYVRKWVWITYHAERSDELLWWLDTGCDDHLDKVGADADDDHHADGLKDSDSEEHLAQRHGTVAWDRHDEGCGWCCRDLRL